MRCSLNDIFPHDQGILSVESLVELSKSLGLVDVLWLLLMAELGGLISM
jgi:hypothetical protein